MIRTLSAIALGFAITLGVCASPRADFRPLIPSNRPTVAYVVDGDTIAVQLGRGVDKVRLIGIDTPESRSNDRAKLQAERSKRDIKTILQLGKQAKETLKSLLPKGTELRLEYDAQQRDKYGRLLAYAYRMDNTMINEEMLLRGYAQLLTIPPNIRYVERLRKALNKAQKEQRGLWASGGFQN